LGGTDVRGHPGRGSARGNRTGQECGSGHGGADDGRTVPLYPQTEGGRLGLMPVAAGTQPGSYPLEFLAEGGTVLRASTITVRDARFRTQNVVLEKAILDLQPAPGEMETVAAFQKAVSETRRWVEPLARPVPGCMVSPYGVRRLHNGKPTGSITGESTSVRRPGSRARGGGRRSQDRPEVQPTRRHGGYGPWTGAGVDLPALSRFATTEARW